MTATHHEKAERFRALHRKGTTFVIANAWDAGSARVLAALGFPALATSSGASAGVLGKLDGAAGKSFRNLTNVILSDPGHLTPYDVLWADQVIFTSHTVGSVGRSSSYEVSKEDFVKEEGGES